MQWVLLVAWITPSAGAVAAAAAAQLRNLPGVVHKINTQSGGATQLGLAWFGAPINPLTRHLNLHTCESIYLSCVVCALRWCLYWGPYAHVNLASKHVPCRQNKHTNTLYCTAERSSKDPVWQQRCEWQCENTSVRTSEYVLLLAQALSPTTVCSNCRQPTIWQPEDLTSW